MLHQVLGLVSALSMFVAFLPLLYISITIRHRNLRLLSILLSFFAVTHGIYHVTFLFGLSELGANIVGPFSALVLAVFAVYYLWRGGSL